MFVQLQQNQVYLFMFILLCIPTFVDAHKPRMIEIIIFLQISKWKQTEEYREEISGKTSLFGSFVSDFELNLN